MSASFFDVIASSSRPFVLIDSNGCILRYNLAFEAFWDQHAYFEENLFYPLWDITTQELPPILKEKLTSGLSFFYSLTYPTQEVEVKIEALPYPGLEGAALQYTVMLEVSENVESQEERNWFNNWVTLEGDNISIRQIKEEFRKLTYLFHETQVISKTGGWKLNLETGSTLWTKEVYRIHEVPTTFDHNKENGIAFYHEEDRPLLIRSLEEARTDKVPFDIQCRFKTAKGNWLRVRVKGKPIIKDGKVTKLVGVIQDITQQYEIEEGLKVMNDRLQLALRAAKMGVWDYLPNENILHWDENLYHIYGIKKEDFSGAYDAWSSTVHPDSIKRAEEELGMALRGEKDFDTEFEIVMPDGKKKIIAGEAIVLRDEKGQAHRMIGVNFDVTEKKLAEQELVKAKEAAEEASQAKSEFLSVMSHEIRTPLNAVIGVSGLLENSPLNQEQEDLVQTIRQGGESLLSVINDILDFSKIESGRMETEEVEFNLSKPIEDVFDILGKEAFNKGIELLYHIESTYQGAFLGDTGRIRQILMNLIGNAIKFTQKGEVVLTVRTKEESPDTCLLGFSIADTGIGIPPEKIEKLFQPFSQVDASTTRKYGGSGLGLAIVKKLLTLMGGSIGLDSELGKGTTFHFTIPFKKAMIAPPKAHFLNQLKGKRILLVDDSPSSLSIMESQLIPKGLLVSSYTNPFQLIEDTQHSEIQSWDLGIIDFHMPDMNGLELGTYLRSHSRCQNMPLILLSAGSIPNRSELRQVFDYIVQKPIKRGILHDQIRKALSVNDPIEKLIPYQVPEKLGPNLSSYSLLLVEDNPMNQKVAKLILKRFHIQIEIASTGQEAIDLVMQRHFDLIFMDLQMPVMDGIQATRHIRALGEEIPQPLIIAVTANCSVEDRTRCLEVGMDDFISKPITLKILRKNLPQWLALTRKATS